VKTQEELRAEFRRLMEAEMLEEAEAVLDQIEPLNDEEWRKWLDAAPVDDEPLTPREIERLAAYDARREQRAATRTG
jgi:hypothetical protein